MNKEKLEKLVYQAIGNASLSWDPKPKGCFDSSQALTIGEELVDEIIKLEEQDKELEEAVSTAVNAYNKARDV